MFKSPGWSRSKSHRDMGQWKTRGLGRLHCTHSSTFTLHQVKGILIFARHSPSDAKSPCQQIFPESICTVTRES